MNDKDLMENLLMTTKGICDFYMHGAIEAGTANVRTVFDQALQESLCMQKDIFSKMSGKGWYPTEQAQQPEIQKVKQQFATSVS